MELHVCKDADPGLQEQLACVPAVGCGRRPSRPCLSQGTGKLALLVLSSLVC